MGAVLASKAEVASFGLELSKKLDMRYKSPPLPVNLNVMSGDKGMTSMMPSLPVEDVDPTKMALPESTNNRLASRHIHSASDLDSIMAMFEKKDANKYCNDKEE